MTRPKDGGSASEAPWLEAGSWSELPPSAYPYHRSTQDVYTVSKERGPAAAAAAAAALTAAFTKDKKTGKKDEGDFEGPYAESRRTRDHAHHGVYHRSRQRVQDAIVHEVLGYCPIEVFSSPSSSASSASTQPKPRVRVEAGGSGSQCVSQGSQGRQCVSRWFLGHKPVLPSVCMQRRPWIVFLAGGMGVGKTYFMRWVHERRYFDVSRYVCIDVDQIRSMLPETPGYMARDKTEAGALTQRECGYLAELAQVEAIKSCKNVLVDASFRDKVWYGSELEALRRNHPVYKVAILKVSCSRPTMHARARRRGEQTGRVVPACLLDAAYDQVDVTVAALTPLADVRIDVDSEAAAPVIRGATRVGGPRDARGRGRVVAETCMRAVEATEGAEGTGNEAAGDEAAMTWREFKEIWERQPAECEELHMAGFPASGNNDKSANITPQMIPQKSSRQ